ncbi:MAG: outer membrane beta-barrel protein, partial [Gammaproteobacteria bacterium]|nr:outer membrane beta-barrel protein [Gammaproteobacteria bacterium]
WRYSPFFTLGIGQIETKPKVTLIQAQDSSDFVAHFGVGVKIYLTRQFILRAEYKNYVGFSSDDDNEEFQEWKAGFGFFF